MALADIVLLCGGRADILPLLGQKVLGFLALPPRARKVEFRGSAQEMGRTSPAQVR